MCGSSLFKKEKVEWGSLVTVGWWIVFGHKSIRIIADRKLLSLSVEKKKFFILRTQFNQEAIGGGGSTFSLVVLFWGFPSETPALYFNDITI